MQKVIALLVIVAVSSSLQSPVETESQTELQSEVESAAEAVPQPNFVIPFFKVGIISQKKKWIYH